MFTRAIQLLATVSLAAHPSHSLSYAGFSEPQIDTLARTVTCTLMNGDRLSGSSVAVRSDTLVLSHDQFGEIPLSLGFVRTCSSIDSVMRALLLPTGKLAPPPMPPPRPKIWRESAAFSYSLARGNANLSDFGFSAGISRLGRRSRWSTGWRTRESTRDGRTSVHQSSASLRLNQALGVGTVADVPADGPVQPYSMPSGSAAGSKATLFQELGYEHDGLKELDRRLIWNLGVSLGLLRNSILRAALDLGAGVIDERFQQVADRVLAGGVIRFGGAQRLPLGASLDERVAMLPDIAQTWRYRLNSDVGIRAPITKAISLQIGLSDRYDTRPRPTVKKNDLSIQSGLGFEF